MKIRYIGGRTHYAVSLNRKSYYFTLENNRTLDIKDQSVINHIFSLSNRAEFQVVAEPQEIIFNKGNNTVSVEPELKKEESKPIKKIKSKKGRK